MKKIAISWIKVGGIALNMEVGHDVSDRTAIVALSWVTFVLNTVVEYVAILKAVAEEVQGVDSVAHMVVDDVVIIHLVICLRLARQVFVESTVAECCVKLKTAPNWPRVDQCVLSMEVPTSAQRKVVVVRVA